VCPRDSIVRLCVLLRLWDCCPPVSSSSIPSCLWFSTDSTPHRFAVAVCPQALALARLDVLLEILFHSLVSTSKSCSIVPSLVIPKIVGPGGSEGGISDVQSQSLPMAKQITAIRRYSCCHHSRLIYARHKASARWAASNAATAGGRSSSLMRRISLIIPGFWEGSASRSSACDARVAA
jgi:hypothetical protein